MAEGRLNKPDLLRDMADHVLVHGLNTASLRPLARAAGTSDRMLIYHFGSKDRLIADLLQHLASRFAARLDAALPAGETHEPAELLAKIVHQLRTVEMRPYLRVWLEIAAEASRGTPAYVETGGAIIERLQDWIMSRLDVPAESRWRAASAMHTTIEGVIVMDAVGRTAIADIAVERNRTAVSAADGRGS